jgi:hypothetical protein
MKRMSFTGNRRPTHIVRRGATVLATTALAVGMTVAFSGTAQAATPECRGTTQLHEQPEYNEMPTTAPRSGQWKCTLGPGDGYVGDQYHAVWILQRSLNKCYGQGIAVDGKYEGETREAVRNVQRFHNHFGAGLAEDGLYGPNTAFYMEFVNTQGQCWT